MRQSTYDPYDPYDTPYDTHTPSSSEEQIADTSSSALTQPILPTAQSTLPSHDKTATTDEAKPSFLLRLPTEVLIRIIEKLDQETAKSVSSTCKTLQPIAEIRLWSDLVFALKHRPTAKPVVREMEMRHPDYGYMVRRKYVVPARKDLSLPKLTKDRHRRLYQRLTQALGYGEDLERKLVALRSADLIVYNTIRPLVLELIKMTAPRLQDLTLRANPYNTNRPRHFVPPFPIAPTSLPTSFPYLTNLAIVDLDIDIASTLLPLLRASPQLRVLQIEGPNLSWWNGLVPQEYQVAGKISALNPKLVELLLHCMSTGNLPPILTALLAGRTRLEALSLQGLAFRSSAVISAIFNVLAKNINLKDLNWGSSRYSQLCEAQRVQLQVRNLVMEQYITRPEWFPRLELVELPRIFPKLEMLVFKGSAQTPRWNTPSQHPGLPGDLFYPPTYSTPLSPKLRSVLSAYPSLHRIGENQAGVSHDQQQLTTLVRTYTDGNNTFTHVKTFSKYWFKSAPIALTPRPPETNWLLNPQKAKLIRHLWSDITRQPFHLSELRLILLQTEERMSINEAGQQIVEIVATLEEPRWEHFAQLNGQAISETRVRRMYEAIGQDMHWKDSGRGMTMSPKGWMVLHDAA